MLHVMHISITAHTKAVLNCTCAAKCVLDVTKNAVLIFSMQARKIYARHKNHHICRIDANKRVLRGFCIQNMHRTYSIDAKVNKPKSSMNGLLQAQQMKQTV
jgi:hypothetical protein